MTSGDAWGALHWERPIMTIGSLTEGTENNSGKPAAMRGRAQRQRLGGAWESLGARAICPLGQTAVSCLLDGEAGLVRSKAPPSCNGL